MPAGLGCHGPAPAACLPRAGDLGFHCGRTFCDADSTRHAYLSSGWLGVILTPKQTWLQFPRSAHRWQVATPQDRSPEDLAQPPGCV